MAGIVFFLGPMCVPIQLSLTSTHFQEKSLYDNIFAFFIKVPAIIFPSK